MKRFISSLSDFLLLKPFFTLLVLSFLIIASIFEISKITINSNQIDLLPASYPEVIKTKKVIEMIGGNGFFIITLKPSDDKGREELLKKAFEFRDKGDLINFEVYKSKADQIKKDNIEYFLKVEQNLKKTSDYIYKNLVNDPDIRYISYKYDVSFLQDRFPLFIVPTDMEMIRERINKKIEIEKEKLSPFYMDLGAEENINFDDILQRYSKLSKRDIFDDYTISQDKGMLIMLVKPNGSIYDVSFGRRFHQKIDKKLNELKIKERGIKFGYTGTYKLNLDDYDSLVDALQPISIASLIGIIILLILFFRKPILILFLTISLIVGVTITFGITGKIIGQLNTITSMLSAVLMGLGIDYGIQFIYRFRDEFTKSEDFIYSVKETIYHTGFASLITALTTTSAFVILMFSDFKGFSEFGMISCFGLLIIAFCMYFVTALQIAIFLKINPNFKNHLYYRESDKLELAFVHKVFDNPQKILTISGILIVVLSSFSFLVQFNYSGRDLLLENQESLYLYDDIANRFEVSSDPQVILVETAEEAEALSDYFHPIPKEMDYIIDQVVSDWNLVPPLDQQKINLHLISKIKQEFIKVPKEIINEEYKQYLPKIQKYLEIKQFEYKDIPEVFKASFKEIPNSKEKGYMLYIYPKIALWHGKDLINFYNTTVKIKFPLVSWRTLNALLHSEKLNYDNPHGDYRQGEFSEEEIKIILEKSNIYSKESFLKLGILEGTADLIIKNRPYHSIKDLRKFNSEASTVGSVILFARLAQIVQTESYIAIISTLFTVMVILIIAYRSFLATLASLIPLILGILVMLGIMGIFGLKINFINILIFPIIIGYSIQNGIYIYYRFLEEKDIAKALVKVGPAITASSLTTFVGWAVLLIAEHRGLHSIGVAASIGILSSLVVAFTLLPAILGRFFSEQNYKTNSGSNFSESPIGATESPLNKFLEKIDEYIELQEEVSFEEVKVSKDIEIKVKKKKNSSRTITKKTIQNKKKTNTKKKKS
jgi:uncharacterized protein